MKELTLTQLKTIVSKAKISDIEDADLKRVDMKSEINFVVDVHASDTKEARAAALETLQNTPENIRGFVLIEESK